MKQNLQINRLFLPLMGGVFGLVFLLPCFVWADEQASSILVPYEVVDVIQSKSIPNSLTGQMGDPLKGEAIMISRQKGNCLACHQVSLFEEKAKSAPNEYGDMGEIGPVLDGVAKRYSEGQLRLLMVDAKLIFPETIMPSFYKVKDLHRVGSQFKNKPILEPQEVEDVIHFLLTLK